MLYEAHLNGRPVLQALRSDLQSHRRARDRNLPPHKWPSRVAVISERLLACVSMALTAKFRLTAAILAPI